MSDTNDWDIDEATSWVRGACLVSRNLGPRPMIGGSLNGCVDAVDSTAKQVVGGIAGDNLTEIYRSMIIVLPFPWVEGIFGRLVTPMRQRVLIHGRWEDARGVQAQTAALMIAADN